MHMFSNRHPFSDLAGWMALPDCEQGNRTDMLGEIENLPHGIIIKSTSPAGIEIFRMSSKHHVRAGDCCILKPVQDPPLPIPGHGPDIIGAYGKYHRRLFEMLLAECGFCKRKPCVFIPDNDDIPCLEIAGTRCSTGTFKDIFDLLFGDLPAVVIAN